MIMKKRYLCGVIKRQVFSSYSFIIHDTTYLAMLCSSMLVKLGVPWNDY